MFFKIVLEIRKTDSHGFINYGVFFIKKKKTPTDNRKTDGFYSKHTRLTAQWGSITGKGTSLLTFFHYFSFSEIVHFFP